MNPYVKSILESNYKFVFAITGGGTIAISEFLKYGGASKNLVSAVVPYSQEAFDRYVGHKPEKYCSPEASRLLAVKAWQNCIEATKTGPMAIGVGVTCSLTKNGSERPGRKHVAYITFHSEQTTKTVNLDLSNGKQTREEQEIYVANVILDELNYWYGVDDFDSLPRVGDRSWDVSSAIGLNVYGGKEKYLKMCLKYGAVETKKLIYPGSFNPFHAGHAKVAEVASEILGLPVEFEISLTNFDKPMIDAISLRDRINSISGKVPECVTNLYITNAPRFIDKAKIFPGATFIIGQDTFERLVRIKHFNEMAAWHSDVETIRRSGCGFLVFPRTDIGTVDKLIKLHEGIINATSVPWELVKDTAHMSSTQIRKEASEQSSK